MLGFKASLDQLERAGRQLAGMMEDSNVVQDIVDLSLAQRSFEANAATVRASDEILGTLLDLFA